MATITQVAEAIESIFGERVEELAHESKFIQRKVRVTGKGFVESLVMAFQTNKAASYSEISACASSLAMPMTAQGMEQRFNERSAQFLKSVLEYAVSIKLEGIEGQNLPLLKRFKGLHIRDSSVIALPVTLKDIWKGVGGTNGETAALKLQVSWEQCRGALDGITLQDGFRHDRSSPYQALELAEGELHLADLGFFSVEKLARDSQKGILWLTRLEFTVSLWDEHEKVLDLLPFLRSQPQPQLDIQVYAGYQHHMACRLLASRVPKEVAEQRRRRIKERYAKRGRQPSEKILQLAAWTLVLTNVPQEKLSLKEALALLKIRWQIELLFKLWKSHLNLDQWTSKNPWRILTEIYAKLLSAILFHWTLLFEFWKYPDRSLVKALKTFQRHVTFLLLCLNNQEAMLKTLNVLAACYAKSCRINKHSNTACTFQALFDPDPILC